MNDSEKDEENGIAYLNHENRNFKNTIDRLYQSSIISNQSK